MDATFGLTGAIGRMVHERTKLQRAIEEVREAGYVVIEKERRVILTASYLHDRHSLERFKGAPERLEDMTIQANLRRISEDILAQGLLMHHKAKSCCPVEGEEVVFRTTIAVIKPKGDE